MAAELGMKPRFRESDVAFVAGIASELEATLPGGIPKTGQAAPETGTKHRLLIAGLTKLGRWGGRWRAWG